MNRRTRGPGMGALLRLALMLTLTAGSGCMESCDLGGGGDGSPTGAPLTEPTQTAPGIEDPTPTAPAVADPTPTEPGAGDPSPTATELPDPTPTEPGAGDPSPTATEIPDPTATEPGAGDPSPTASIPQSPTQPAHTPTQTAPPSTPTSTPPTPTAAPPTDRDHDDHLSDEDCDDADPEVYPGALERCDGADQDCDGIVDEEPSDPGAFYPDGDGDGFAPDDAEAILACAPPPGYVPALGDCDDSDAALSPSTVWSFDGDGDGYGQGAQQKTQCQRPAGYVLIGGDCRDGDPAVHPDANEVCDGRDNDCDGAADDDDDLDLTTADPFYVDADCDGFPSQTDTFYRCAAPSGPPCYVPVPDAGEEDCDDADPAAHPGAQEVCDAADADEDCDGLADDADPSVDPASAASWWVDADGDGYGAEGSAPTLACDLPQGFADNDLDCDDLSAGWNLAEEGCGYDGVVYVDDDAPAQGADGRSWATAFPTLHGARAWFVARGERYGITSLWIAHGRYYAAAAGEPVLRMVEGLEVVGGFEGVEASETERPHPLPGEEGFDLSVSATILDGDYNGSGDFDDGDSPHVAVIAEGARLDGVALTGGDGTLADDRNGGGGAFLDNLCRAEITHAHVEGNRGGYGGGIMAFGAPPGVDCAEPLIQLESVTVFDNASTSNGGGLYAVSQESRRPILLLRDVVLSWNSTEGHGGGFYFSDLPVVAEELRVLHNETIGSHSGGGGYVLHSAPESAITLRDARFEGNRAASAGALYLATAVVDLQGVDFVDNEVGGSGGAIYAVDLQGTLEDTRFVGNRANGSLGGAIYVQRAQDLLLTDVTFDSNTAGRDGGGLYVATTTVEEGHRGVRLMGGRFLGNSASYRGGALVAYITDRVEVVDSVFDSNEAGEDGGAIWISQAPVLVYGASFTGNRAVTGRGGAIATFELTTLTVAGSSFRDNKAASWQHAIYAPSSAQRNAIVVSHSAFWLSCSQSGFCTNDVAPADLGTTIRYSCLVQEETGDTNVVLSADPFDRRDEDGDGAPELYLAASSPCRDLGGDDELDALVAEIGASDWRPRTTDGDGCAPDASPADAGRHHPVEVCAAPAP